MLKIDVEKTTDVAVVRGFAGLVIGRTDQWNFSRLFLGPAQLD